MFNPTDRKTLISQVYWLFWLVSTEWEEGWTSSNSWSGFKVYSNFIITSLCCRHCNSYGRAQIFWGIFEVSWLGGRYRPWNRRGVEEEYPKGFDIFWRPSQVTRKGRVGENVQSAIRKERRSHSQIGTVLVQRLLEDRWLEIHLDRDNFGRVLPRWQKY